MTDGIVFSWSVCDDDDNVLRNNNDAFVLAVVIVVGVTIFAVVFGLVLDWIGFNGNNDDFVLVGFLVDTTADCRTGTCRKSCDSIASL